MPMKGSGPATDWREIDEWEGGTGWIAYPNEAMQRASHALDGDDGVWLVDPVDCEGLDDLIAERGDVAGVAILLDRHKRDAAAIARRHDVPVSVPDFMAEVEGDLDAPVELLHKDLPGTEYEIHDIIDNRFWREAILWGPETQTMLVPEAVGTTSYFRTDAERIGVAVPLRLKPPRKLGRLTPDRILVGHGASVFEDANEALADALEGARRRAPRLYANVARDLLF